MCAVKHVMLYRYLSIAGMSEYIVMVKGNAQLALAGEKLVYMATGEKSTDEMLGRYIECVNFFLFHILH